jgi:hypothetical protein
LRARCCWGVLTVLLLAQAVALCGFPERASADAKLRPESLLSFAEEHPKDELPVFIFSQKPDSLRAVIAQKIMPGTKAVELPVINAIAAQIRGDALQSLAKDSRILAIHYVADDVYPMTVNLVDHVQRALTDGVTVMNMSIRSPRAEVDAGDPVNLATYVAWLSGSIAVVAAGNGGPYAGSINPWCTPYVICVGAAVNDGSELWRGSSRASEDEKIMVPTVVAPGVDVRVGDQVLTGTSPATAHASAIAILIAWFASREIEACKKSGRASFSLRYDLPLNRTPDVRVVQQRIVGKLTLNGDSRTVEYPAVLSAGLIKQLIMDMAVGIRNYDSTSIGAGFVNYEMAWRYFGKYGKPELGTMYLDEIGK